jgi:PAS domain S-box-containing protein
LDKIIGRSFEDNQFLEDYAGVLHDFEQLPPQHPVRKNTNRMLTSNGKTVWVEWTDRGIFEVDQLVEIYGLGKNITDTYKRDLLQQSIEQRFQALVENLPMVVYVIHAKTFSPVYISPEVEKLTGYTPEEFYKNPEVWMNAMHPDDANIFYQLLEDWIEKNIAAPVEFRMYHKDGRLRWVEETGTTINLPDGTVLFQGVSRDVTERHNTREKLVYYSNFEHMINETSLKLMNANLENISEILQNIVNILGVYLQVDRSYIFDFNYTDQTMSNTFEWCNDGIRSEIANLQKLPFSEFPWWIQKMEKNQEISLETLDDLPPEEKDLKDFLSSQDIRSLLVVPMFNNGKTSGFIGFDMVTRTTHWENEVIQLLRIASAMITSTRERLVDLS